MGKIILITVIFISSFFYPTYSQANYKYALGYRFALGKSNISGSGTPEEMAGDFSGGPINLFFEGKIHQNISIQVEVMWLILGADSHNSTDNLDYSYTYDYVNIPLFLKLKLSSDNFQPYLAFGGWYSKLVGANRTTIGSLSRTDIMDETASDQYGVAFSFGFDAKLTKHFIIGSELRFYKAMNNFYKDDAREAKFDGIYVLFSIGAAW